MTDQTARTLTPSEHDRAWHAIEHATGQDDADPGSVLAAVLRALRINAPTIEDEQAASPRNRDAARQAAGRPPAPKGWTWSLPPAAGQTTTECAMPGFMGCECNHLSGCQHPAPAVEHTCPDGEPCPAHDESVVEQPAEAQPADRAAILREAASNLDAFGYREAAAFLLRMVEKGDGTWVPRYGRPLSPEDQAMETLAATDEETR